MANDFYVTTDAALGMCDGCRFKQDVFRVESSDGCAWSACSECIHEHEKMGTVHDERPSILKARIAALESGARFAVDRLTAWEETQGRLACHALPGPEEILHANAAVNYRGIRQRLEAALRA